MKEDEMRSLVESFRSSARELGRDVEVVDRELVDELCALIRHFAHCRTFLPDDTLLTWLSTLRATVAGHPEIVTWFQDAARSRIGSARYEQEVDERTFACPGECGRRHVVVSEPDRYRYPGRFTCLCGQDITRLVKGEKG